MRVNVLYKPHGGPTWDRDYEMETLPRLGESLVVEGFHWCVHEVRLPLEPGQDDLEYPQIVIRDFTL